MLIIQIVLGIFGIYFLYRVADISSKHEDLIDCYIEKKNPFLSDSNKVIKDYNNNIRWFIFIVISFSLSFYF